MLSQQPVQHSSLLSAFSCEFISSNADNLLYRACQYCIGHHRLTSRSMTMDFFQIFTNFSISLLSARSGQHSHSLTTFACIRDVHTGTLLTNYKGNACGRNALSLLGSSYMVSAQSGKGQAIHFWTWEKVRTYQHLLLLYICQVIGQCIM